MYNRNKQLADKIISCFDWWELEDTEQNTKEILDLLDRNDPKELEELANNFRETKQGLISNEKLESIITEILGRIKK